MTEEQYMLGATPLVRFNQTRTRGRKTDSIPARLLEELKNGPVIVAHSRVIGLMHYRKKMEAAGTPAPAVKSYRLESDSNQSCLTLADGPFERFVEQPDWV